MVVELTLDEIKQEWLACQSSCAYFICNYVKIYDAVLKEWIDFILWPAQYKVLKLLISEQLVIILKARQEGLTWLCLAFILWLMLFHPATAALIFSRRDVEAIYLLSKERMRGMYNRLPDWMKAKRVDNDSGHLWLLSNGSSATAFPTSAGDSYTASVALVDEAALVPDLGRLLRAVKPTIDAGGKLILLSRSNKDEPGSEFNNTYRGARSGQNNWHPIFLPWSARPDRTLEWYEEQRREILTRTGSLDDLWEQYPETDEQALAARVLDKRISPVWLLRCYHSLEPVRITQDFRVKDAPAIPGLEIFQAPVPGRRYVIGADPAEGNPTSDDSALEVLDVETGEEVAKLQGKFQPSTFASHIDVVGQFYNDAPAMVERNNHGHAVLLWLGEYSRLRLLSIDSYLDPHKILAKPGWLDNSRGKTLLYDCCADSFKNNDTILHSFTTFEQLSSVEGSTLRAPEGYPDDCADAFSLGLVGRVIIGAKKRGGAWTSH